MSTGKETKQFAGCGKYDSMYADVDHNEKTIKFYRWYHDPEWPEVIGDLVHLKASDCRGNSECERFLSEHRNYRTDGDSSSGARIGLLAVGAVFAVGGVLFLASRTRNSNTTSSTEHN